MKKILITLSLLFIANFSLAHNDSDDKYTVTCNCASHGTKMDNDATFKTDGEFIVNGHLQNFSRQAEGLCATVNYSASLRISAYNCSAKETAGE